MSQIWKKPNEARAALVVQGGKTMREYMGIFRGKRKDNGEWVEGNLFIPDKVTRLDVPTEILVGTNVVRISYEVDPDTVGECTGLRDKNGKLIFEGDIVHSDDYFTAVVEWDSNHARYVLAIIHEAEIDDHVNLTRGKAGKLTVIGNIHDNPELLKGGEGE